MSLTHLVSCVWEFCHQKRNFDLICKEWLQLVFPPKWFSVKNHQQERCVWFCHCWRFLLVRDKVTTLSIITYVSDSVWTALKCSVKNRASHVKSGQSDCVIGSKTLFLCSPAALVCLNVMCLYSNYRGGRKLRQATWSHNLQWHHIVSCRVSQDAGKTSLETFSSCLFPILYLSSPFFCLYADRRLLLLVCLISSLPVTSTKLDMDFSQSFSLLNEQLRPRITTNQQLYSTLSRLEDKQWGSLRSQCSYRPTILPTEPKNCVTTAEPEEPEPEETAIGENEVSVDLDERDSPLITDLNLKDAGEEELSDKDSNTSPTEEKDIPGELASNVTSESTESGSGDSGSCSLQTNYLDGTLPDLIRSGRPLGRRRTLGPVSDTVGRLTLL